MRSRFTELSSLPIAVCVGHHRSEILYWGHFGARWWRNHLHAHSFYEICYAFEGRGTFEVNGQLHDIRPGHVFVAKPGEPHEIISSRKKPLGIYFWAYMLVPPPPGTGPDDQVDPTDALLDAFGRSQRWVAPARMIQQTVKMLTEEIVHRKPGYVQVINGLVIKLLLDTARAVVDLPIVSERVDPPVRNADQATVQTLLRYLRDNYARPISIGDLAGQVHFSERHISRLFRKVLGRSVLDYVTQLRIEAASRLLLDPTRPIKRIATEIGYADVRYFTTLFRRETGLTPATFRKERGTRQLRDARNR
jgi:AraC-like DNA-binding protein